MTKQLLKLLSEKPYHLDHQERVRLIRNWKQDCDKLIKQINKG